MSEPIQGAPASAPESSLTPAQSALSQDTPQSTEGQANPAELQDVIENGTPAEVKAAKKMLKTLKIKVDGKEYDEALPFEIEDTAENTDYMRKQLQLARMGQDRSKKLSTLEGEVRDFIEELKKNPRKVLSDPTIGVDVKKMAAELIEEEIANSQKSPEQLEIEKAQKELKELKAEREKEKEESKKREFERIQQESFERYDMLIGQAIEKSDLPKSPYIVKKMADYMLLGLQNGMDVNPSDVIGIIRDEVQDELKQMFSVMPEEVIETIIGKDVFNRVRKKNVAKLKAKNAPATGQNVAQDTGNSGSKEAKPVVKQSMKDYFGF